MRLLPILLLCLTFASSCLAQKKGGSITIKGKVTTTADYCGGAAPSEEMLERLRTPQPAVRKVILVKYGTVNAENLRVVKRIVTDSNGHFSVTLKKGFDYQFVEEWKAQPFRVPANTEFVKWDAACLQKRYATPDAVCRKKQRGGTVDMNFHQPCFFHPYCGGYSGPLPP
jgi:hypothetical protein